MGPHIRVAVDVGKNSHHMGIADPKGKVLEEFFIPHSQEGFGEFFIRVERHRKELGLPVAVAMEGEGGHARPLDRMILEKGLHRRGDQEKAERAIRRLDLAAHGQRVSPGDEDTFVVYQK